MSFNLPQTSEELINWTWTRIEPYYHELSIKALDESNLAEWLIDWSELGRRLREIFQRLYVGITVNTNDETANLRYEKYLDEIFPKSQAAEQELKVKLLRTGMIPSGMELPIRKIKAETEIYREANNPLLSEELKLAAEYDKIIGAQTVTWDGKETTISQLDPVYQEIDREKRARAWRLARARQLSDRQAINELWVRFMDVRGALAANAGCDNYRSYRWQQLLRLDYTPQDCYEFHAAIRKVAVPAAARINAKRQAALQLESLRPWDQSVNIYHLPPLKPFSQIEELESKTAVIFNHVDPQLGAYFETMRQEKLLDLDNRKGKAPGGYCTGFPFARRPFIFMNSVGVHDDVQTLLHEGGHAFHVFETASLPYVQQLDIGLEFDEVASMAMELLSAPYLTTEFGGFYSPGEAARARVEHLETSICFWPYMAVVDLFQHWVYENHKLASIPENCDLKWTELWDEYMPDIDWSGFDDAKATGWQRKLHIHEVPFYYIEYGLAQMGAVQVWSNALRDQAEAVKAYRSALRLGGTATIPELYEAAGARFAFDQDTLERVVGLMEETIETLDQSIER